MDKIATFGLGIGLVIAAGILVWTAYTSGQASMVKECANFGQMRFNTLVIECPVKETP